MKKVKNAILNKIEKSCFFLFGTKEASSFSWLMVGQIISIVCISILSIIQVRVYHPEQIGEMTYGRTYANLFVPLLQFGIENIVIKDLSIKEYPRNKIIGSSIAVCTFGQFIAIVICVLSAIIRHITIDRVVFIAIFMMPWLLYFLNVYKFILLADSDLREYSIATCVVKLSFLIIEFAVIFTLPIIWYAITICVGNCFEIIVAYFITLKKKKIDRKLEIDTSLIKKYLKLGIPFVLSSVSITVYMTIDQLMVGGMLGDYELGIYSVAVTFSVFWYFVPSSLYTAYLPTASAIKNTKDEYNDLLQKLADNLALVGYLAIIILQFIGMYLIPIICGETYRYSGKLICVYAISSIFMSLSYHYSIYLTIFEKSVYSLMVSLTGCVVNIIFNYFLIIKIGSMGAVISTVITLFVTCILAPLFIGIWNREVRKMMVMEIKSLFPFVRIYRRFVERNIHNEGL